MQVNSTAIYAQLKKTPEGKARLLTLHSRKNGKYPHLEPIPVGWYEAQLEAQQGKCALCGDDFTEPMLPELDHIRPRSKGGTNNVTNLQLVHRRCNQVKGARLPDC